MAGKSLRQRFEESYIPVTVVSEDGKNTSVRYIYYESWYVWGTSKAAHVRDKWFLSIASLLSCVMLLTSAVIPSEVNSMPWVYVPCTVSLCCCIMELSGIVQFVTAPVRTTKLTFYEVDRIMRFFPIVRTISSVLACASSGYLICERSLPVNQIWISFGYGFCGILAWWIAKKYASIPVSTEKNTVLDELEKSGQET